MILLPLLCNYSLEIPNGKRKFDPLPVTKLQIVYNSYDKIRMIMITFQGSCLGLQASWRIDLLKATQELKTK